MDFAVLPPEINSGLMYTGPGSAPMIGCRGVLGQPCNRDVFGGKQITGQ